MFFDLPVTTTENRRNYSRFKRFLTKNGFMMMQESVYSKIAQNTTVADAVSEKIRKNKPPEGLVQMLVVTEKQFERMEFIIGNYEGDVIISDERFIEL